MLGIFLHTRTSPTFFVPFPKLNLTSLKALLRSNHNLNNSISKQIECFFRISMSVFFESFIS